jgi:hypothetical protein
VGTSASHPSRQHSVIFTASTTLKTNKHAHSFDTAVEEAQRSLLAAKVEAASAYRGVGLVKLMGRQSGFLCVSRVFSFELSAGWSRA